MAVASHAYKYKFAVAIGLLTSLTACGHKTSSVAGTVPALPVSVKHLASGTSVGELFSHRYVGIELPVGPPIYSEVLQRMHQTAEVTSGPFIYHVGTLEGEPVVVNVPSLDGITIRSLATERMETLFHIGAFLYAGTSGSHLASLTFGDVVLGARIVDFGNFITSTAGAITPGEFHNTQAGIGSGKFLYLYSNPTLLDLAASVTAPRNLGVTPAAVLAGKTSRYPWVMKYGTQGSSEMWLKDPTLIAASDRVFKEVDESGDYPSALASMENHVPFLELNTISDAPLNVPTTFDAFFHQDSVFAQKRSNMILFALLKAMAERRLVTPPWVNPTQDPYPAGTFSHAVVPPPAVESWTAANGTAR